MKIALFMVDIYCAVGGTESYFSNLFETLQAFFPNAYFEIITNYLPKKKNLSECLVEKLNEKFGTTLKPNFSVKKIPFSLSRSISFLFDYVWFAFYTKGFDLCINCCSTTFVAKASKNYNIIHFPSSPFSQKKARHIFLRRKMDKLWTSSYDFFLCNSLYTSSWLKKIWNVDNSKVKIIYPPVELLKARFSKKKQIIVCSRIEKSKSIHELIKAFSLLNLSDVQLIIAGALLPEDQQYYEYLLRLAGSLNLHWELNPSREKLIQLYQDSLVFWHAKGCEIQEEQQPYLLEHFGITTVEAMSAGCIPVVIDKGGQQEIVDNGINGFRWTDINSLVSITKMVFESTNVSLLQQEAIKKTQKYGTEAFARSLRDILQIDGFLG